MFRARIYRSLVGGELTRTHNTVTEKERPIIFVVHVLLRAMELLTRGGKRIMRDALNDCAKHDRCSMRAVSRECKVQRDLLVIRCVTCVRNEFAWREVAQVRKLPHFFEGSPSGNRMFSDNYDI